MPLTGRSKDNSSCLQALFWLAGFAVICIALGGMAAWSLNSLEHHERERSLWVKGEAALDEVGVCKNYGKHTSGYSMTVVYRLTVEGRTYEGRKIRGGSSLSATEVKSWVLPFAPEAAEVDLDKLPFPHHSRTWPGVGRRVPVRYDPNDPGRSEMLLPHSTPYENRVTGAAVGIIVGLLVTGLGLLILTGFLWRTVRKEEAPLA
jgi:hypothetical protein